MEAGHRVNELRWQIIEKVEENNPQQIGTSLLKRETHWIIELDTLAPKGLNEACNFSAFM